MLATISFEALLNLKSKIMNLSKEEREHYEWQKEIYYSFVGELISEVSRMEGFMMETLSLHFVKNRKGSCTSPLNGWTKI